MATLKSTIQKVVATLKKTQVTPSEAMVRMRTVQEAAKKAGQEVRDEKEKSYR